MQVIIEIFGDHAGRLANIIAALSQHVEGLRQSGASEAGVQSIGEEIEHTLLPQLRKLHQILDESHQQTTRFVDQVQQLSPAMSQLMDQLPRLKAITQLIHENQIQTLARQAAQEQAAQRAALQEDDDHDDPGR